MNIVAAKYRLKVLMGHVTGQGRPGNDLNIPPLAAISSKRTTPYTAGRDINIS